MTMLQEQAVQMIQDIYMVVLIDTNVIIDKEI